MNLYALLGLCFIPTAVFFILAVILNKNFKMTYGFFSCILGLVTVIPTSFIQYYVLNLPIFNNYTFASVLITAVIFNGLIEESMKLFFICLIPQKKQTLAPFFCCAILYGLCVGGFESVVYVIRKVQEISAYSGEKALLKLLLERIFSAQAVHTFCAGLSGLYIWTFRKNRRGIMPFIYAVVLHGIYNFFVSFTSGFRWLAFVAILLAAVECRIFYLSNLDKQKE